MKAKSRFPSAEVVLLRQAVFDSPKRLFHECLTKNQANDNLPFFGIRDEDNNIHDASQGTS